MMPGITINLNNFAIKERSSTPLMVDVEGVPCLRSLVEKALFISVSPDSNVWIPMYNSWYYQFFMRWFTGTVFLISGCTAGLFLFRHLIIIRKKFLTKVASSNRSSTTLWKFCYSRLNIIFFALFVELIYAPTLSGFLLLGGMGSTVYIGEQITLFFITHLSGLSFVATLLSAAVWNRMLSKLENTQDLSFFGKIINGKYPRVTMILITVPLVIDLTISWLYALRIIVAQSFFSHYIAGIYAFLEFVFGCFFFFSARRYQKKAKTITESANIEDASVAEVMKRTSIIAISIAFSMMMYTIGSSIMAFSMTFFFTPTGWALAWSIATCGHCFQSLFHVIMFRPQWGKHLHATEFQTFSRAKKIANRRVTKVISNSDTSEINSEMTENALRIEKSITRL